MVGNPTNRADLRAVKVNLAKMTILLSAMVRPTVYLKKCIFKTSHR